MSRITFPRAVDNPREMPELRAALIDHANNGSVWERAEAERLMRDLDGPDGYSGVDIETKVRAALMQADNSIRWYREHLPICQLIHVSEDMTDFVVAAAEHVPGDMRLAREDMPSPAGLVVFAKPVFGTDAGPDSAGSTVRVDGIAWGEVSLPARDVPWYEMGPIESEEQFVHGVSIAMFRMLDPSQKDPFINQFVLHRPMWVPLGRTDWPWQDRLDLKPTEYLPNASEEQWVSMQEDRRLLVALWATLNQKRLVTTTALPPDKYVNKRLKRAGHAERDESVMIVHLRRSEYRMLQDAEPSGRKINKRFVVRPHYRRQPYGPGRQLRRLTLIPAHWKGPDDAPISHVERVWEVDR